MQGAAGLCPTAAASSPWPASQRARGLAANAAQPHVSPDAWWRSAHALPAGRCCSPSESATATAAVTAKEARQTAAPLAKAVAAVAPCVLLASATTSAAPPGFVVGGGTPLLRGQLHGSQRGAAARQTRCTGEARRPRGLQPPHGGAAVARRASSRLVSPRTAHASPRHATQTLAPPCSAGWPQVPPPPPPARRLAIAPSSARGRLWERWSSDCRCWGWC